MVQRLSVETPSGFMREEKQPEILLGRITRKFDVNESINSSGENAFDVNSEEELKISQESQDLSMFSDSELDDKMIIALDEIRSMKEFRQLMDDHEDSVYARNIAKDPSVLLNFIIDSKYRPKKAFKAFSDMMEWRSNIGVDQALLWRFPNVELMKTEYPHFFYGFDKEGRPIYIERLGKMNVKKFLQHTTIDEFTSYHICYWEYLQRVVYPRASARTGKKISKVVTIVDLSGLGRDQFHSAAIEVLKRIAKIDQEFYPESAHKLYIVNVPWIFQAVWSIIKPWINARGRAQIQIVRKNVEETLLNEIDADQLPEFLGGSSPDFKVTEEEEMWLRLCKEGLDPSEYTH